jgi:hypothetical protein
MMVFRMLVSCRIGVPAFVEKVEGARRGRPGQGGDMTEYLIAFNDEWVPDHTLEELQEKSRALRPLLAEMRAAGGATLPGPHATSGDFLTTHHSTTSAGR